MSLACIYHKKLSMKVVSFEEREKLVTSGEWFSHPNCEQIIEVTKNEKPIRQRARERRIYAKQQTKEI